MITEWVPAAGSGADIDSGLLHQFAALADTIRADAGAAREVLGEQSVERAQRWLKLPESAWTSIVSRLPEQDLFPLAIFFTVAEGTFPGWQCGPTNPAIWLFRHMKLQGILPEKTAIRELKSLTDNRYIPYGSAL